MRKRMKDDFEFDPVAFVGYLKLDGAGNMGFDKDPKLTGNATTRIDFDTSTGQLLFTPLRGIREALTWAMEEGL